MFSLTGSVFQVWFLRPLRRIVSSGFVYVGTALRPCLRQATFLLWAVGAVQVAESVREMRFWWHSVRTGLRQVGRTPGTLRIAAEGEVGPS